MSLNARSQPTGFVEYVDHCRVESALTGKGLMEAELEMERVELQRKVAELEETSHLRAHRSTSGGR